MEYDGSVETRGAAALALRPAVNRYVGDHLFLKEAPTKLNAGLIAALMASAEGPYYLAAAVLAAGLGIEFFRYLRTRRSLKHAREVFAALPDPQLPSAP